MWHGCATRHLVYLQIAASRVCLYVCDSSRIFSIYVCLLSHTPFEWFHSAMVACPPADRRAKVRMCPQPAFLLLFQFKLSIHCNFKRIFSVFKGATVILLLLSAGSVCKLLLFIYAAIVFLRRLSFL